MDCTTRAGADGGKAQLTRPSRRVRTSVLVLGMHRSGTSALTGALGKLSIDLGPNLLDPGEDNPVGYFEHSEVVAVNEATLTAIASSWDDPEFIDELPVPVRQRLTASLQTLLEQDFARSETFAIKDPRVCRFPDIYLAALAEFGATTIPIVALRAPAEVRQSLSKRDGLDGEHVSWLWLRHTLNALTAAGMQHDHLLFYDRLVAAPEAELARLARLIGVQDQAVSDSHASIRGFVSPALRHHTRHDTRPETDPASRTADTLFEQLQTATSDADVTRATHQAATWLRTHTDTHVHIQYQRRMIARQAQTVKDAFASKMAAYPLDYFLLRLRIKGGNVVVAKTNSLVFMKFHRRWLHHAIDRAAQMRRSPGRITAAASSIQTTLFGFPS